MLTAIHDQARMLQLYDQMAVVKTMRTKDYRQKISLTGWEKLTNEYNHPFSYQTMELTEKCIEQDVSNFLVLVAKRVEP